MSSSKETTTGSVNEVAQLSTSNDSDNTLDKKVRLAKKFDKEMKDYAKATVKEFLGIYGYEEDVDINIEDSAEPGLSNQSDSISQNTQTELNSKQLTNQSPCETISSPDYGNGECITESDKRDQSSVITHQTSGSISFTVVSTNCCDCTTGEEPLETLWGPSESLGESSGCLGESSGCLGESSEIKTRLGATLQDEEQLEEEDSFVYEHWTTNGNILGLSVKDKSRLRMRNKRFRETAEERAQRLQGQRDRARFRRANESEGEREFRLVKDRTRQRVKRTKEPDEERKTRLLRQRQSAQKRRSTESAEQRQERLIKDRERIRTRRETERAAGVVGTQ